MKQILLLAIIHLLIYHQYQKDKKQQKFFTSAKTIVTIKKEQKNDLNTLLHDLQMNRSDSSFFLYATGLVGYNFADYSFLLKKQGVNLVWISPK